MRRRTPTARLRRGLCGDRPSRRHVRGRVCPGKLVELRDIVAERGGSLVVVGASARVARTLTLAKLDSLLSSARRSESHTLFMIDPLRFGRPRSVHPSRAGRGSPTLRPPNRICAAALSGSFGVARSVLPSPRNGNLIGFYDKQTVSRKMAHSSGPVCRSRRSRNPETALAPCPSP